MNIRSLLGTLLLLAASQAQAAMYKWTDAQGQVQFGQFPPPGVAAEPVKPPPPPASRPPTERPDVQERLRALEERKQQERERETEAREKREQAALVEQNCRNARASIRLLETGGNRLYRMPDGSVTRMDDQERQRRMNESKKYLAEHCS